MDFIIKEHINVGISACNFGARFRYDHAGWDRVGNLGREMSDYAWTPVCPEVLAGLGIPRATIRLTGGNGDDLWAGTGKVKDRSGHDVSVAVKAASLASLEALRRAKVDAFLYMEGSPTCGIQRTTLKNKNLGKPPGAFGSLLLKEKFFLISALDLDSPWKWWDHRRRLHAFVWTKRLKIFLKKDLYEAWHALKFICQEVDRAAADDIGRSLSSFSRKPVVTDTELWRERVMGLLRRPSTLQRIQSVMVKHVAHYRKVFGLKFIDVQAPSERTGKAAYINALSVLERKAAERGYLFADRPILYKPER